MGGHLRYCETKTGGKEESDMQVATVGGISPHSAHSKDSLVL